MKPIKQASMHAHAPAMSPWASAMPPDGPTLLLAILKSSMRGARLSTLAMCSAPCDKTIGNREGDKGIVIRQ